ncbi:MAG: hypothetical protein Q8Q01_05715 [archaeon]|nr:hypothetical protein [archaeon]
MGLLRFISGILGILLIIGAFSSFIPLLFLGGIVTGSVAFAFGFPIFLMVLGAVMVYFSFYYAGSRDKSNYQLISIVKWGAIHTIAILLGSYVVNRLMVVDTLLVTLFIATIVSLVTQVVRSHESRFNTRWFVFYFLIYANIIWAMGAFIIPEIASQPSVFTSIVIGFTIAGVVAILQKFNVRYHSTQWVSIILLILLLVGNLESLQISPIQQLVGQFPNTSELSKTKLECPTAISSFQLAKTDEYLNPTLIGPELNNLIDTSVWRIEGNIRSCYLGKYRGQYPDWFYCDDLIVSRWETTDSGTIRYRWYTAVTAEWQPKAKPFAKQYLFNGFSCENGKKVSVDKEATAYYVHVSRDGTEIKIEY